MSDGAPGGLRRDTLLNLAGQLLPLAVAVFAVPAITRGLGIERFGILALAWTVLGSFNVLDLALGRALTRFAAEALARGEEERLPDLLGSATALQAALGTVAAVVFAAAAPLLAGRVLHVPAPLLGEARETFLLLALSFPMTLTTGCLRSLLEAARRFDLINLVRAPAGAATFAIPWLGAARGWSLPAIVGLLVLTRGAVLAVHWLFCRHALPAARKPRLRRAVLARLARFGGWITAANAIPPLLVLTERFLLGALVSLAAVAHFSVPYEMVFRLWVLPTSALAALFPVLSAAAGQGDVRAVTTLSRRASRAILLLLAAPVAVALAGARPVLELWMGTGFAAEGATVLRLLAVGLLFSALGSVPAAVLQATGRPDLTARLRIAELFVAIPLSWLLIRHWGTAGAALGAALRAAADSAVLHRLHRIGVRRLGGVEPVALPASSPAPGMNKVPLGSG